MNRTVKRALLWSVSALMLGAASLYGAFIYQMLNEDPVLLLVRVETQPIVRPAAKLILTHVSLTPETVIELNKQAGAVYPLSMMKNDRDAQEMLALFIARGVDVNAGDQRFKNLTAMHSMAMYGSVDRARMLIKHGARVDVRDTLGRTPLDLARNVQRNHPDERAAAMVQFLEAQEPKQKPAR